MANKKMLLFSTLGLVLVIILVWFLIKGINQVSTSPSKATTPNNSQMVASTSKTRTPISPDMKVPGVGEKVSDNIATPQVVVAAAPGATAQDRSFNITVSADQFLPSTIIINAGDTARINLTAKDKNYDFYQPDYGFSLQLNTGATKLLLFQGTNAGKFTFYCRSCGGPDKGPTGFIEVVPKK